MDTAQEVSTVDAVGDEGREKRRASEVPQYCPGDLGVPASVDLQALGTRVGYRGLVAAIDCTLPTLEGIVAPAHFPTTDDIVEQVYGTASNASGSSAGLLGVSAGAGGGGTASPGPGAPGGGKEPLGVDIPPVGSEVLRPLDAPLLPLRPPSVSGSAAPLLFGSPVAAGLPSLPCLEEPLPGTEDVPEVGSEGEGEGQGQGQEDAHVSGPGAEDEVVGAAAAGEGLAEGEEGGGGVPGSGSTSGDEAARVPIVDVEDVEA